MADNTVRNIAGVALGAVVIGVAFAVVQMVRTDKRLQLRHYFAPLSLK